MRDQEIMGERLIALRGYIIGHLIGRYNLTEADAEDVYGDSCEYMLRRGYQLLDLTQDFDAAIMNTAKRRALTASLCGFRR